MCYALVDEPHSVRVLGDEPVYMYLSVTPHIQPTHTFFDDGQAFTAALPAIQRL